MPRVKKDEEEKILFKITPDIFISTDAHNVIVNRKMGVSGPRAKNKYKIVQSFHNNLEGALLKVFNTMTRDKPTSLTNAVKVFKECKEEIVKAVQ